MLSVFYLHLAGHELMMRGMVGRLACFALRKMWYGRDFSFFLTWVSSLVLPLLLLLLFVLLIAFRRLYLTWLYLYLRYQLLKLLLFLDCNTLCILRLSVLLLHGDRRAMEAHDMLAVYKD